MTELKEEWHKKVCRTFSKARLINPLNKWIGTPYANEFGSYGSVHRCRICGLEVYSESRRRNSIIVYWYRWIKKPDFFYWLNNENNLSKRKKK